MKGLTIEYYDRFNCIGGVCPLSCCEFSWLILIDKETEAYYQSLEGDLGQELKDNMCRAEGKTVFRMDCDYRCHFLREDGLCRLVLALGEEKLCNTCRHYPRYEALYGDVMFYGLNISCPEVGRLLLSGKEKLCFDFKEGMPGEVPTDTNWSRFNNMIAAYLTANRIVQDRTLDMRRRICAMILFAEQMQECMDTGDDPAEVLNFFSASEGVASVLDEIQGIDKDIRKKTELLTLYATEVVKRPVYRRVLELFSLITEKLGTTKQEIDLLYEHYDLEVPAEEQENLMVYLLFRHSMRGWEEGKFRDAVFHCIVCFLLYESMSVLCVKGNRISSFEERILQLAIQDRILEHDRPASEAFWDKIKEKMNTEWLLKAIW